VARKQAAPVAQRDIIEGKWELATNGRWPNTVAVFEVWRKEGEVLTVTGYLVRRDGAETTRATLAEAGALARGDPP
jgi:hypothetical protein